MTEINYNVAPEGDNYLLMLSASWCGPCRQFTPTFETAAKEHDGDVDFYKVDIDDHPEIAEHYNVMSVPTIIRGSSEGLEKIDERRPVPFLKYVESL